MRVLCVQARVETMYEAEEVLLGSWGQRHQRGTRSIGHSVITLYLYKDGGTLPGIHHHSLAGERCPPQF